MDVVISSTDYKTVVLKYTNREKNEHNFNYTAVIFTLSVHNLLLICFQLNSTFTLLNDSYLLLYRLTKICIIKEKDIKNNFFVCIIISNFAYSRIRLLR